MVTGFENFRKSMDKLRRDWIGVGLVNPNPADGDYCKKYVVADIYPMLIVSIVYDGKDSPSQVPFSKICKDRIVSLPEHLKDSRGKEGQLARAV